MLHFGMIENAAVVLQGVARVTPLLESELINQQLGCRLLVKAECLQFTGSFKIRGAYVKIASLDNDLRKTGVVAFSSGNHAQGVAASATRMGIASTVVMPEDAPAIKLRNTARYGARVVTYDRLTEDRVRVAQDISARTGAVIIPPYDDYVLIAGQGTVGIEIAQQLGEHGLIADALVCPAGGGGLVAGVATAMAQLSPRTAIYSAEPEHFDDTRRSLMRGERVKNEPGSSSICDAIVTPTPGEKTFPINKEMLAGGFAVSDREVILAMQALADHFKIIVEPGGAVAVATVLVNKDRWENQTVVAVASGGNVDLTSWRNFIT